MCSVKACGDEEEEFEELKPVNDNDHDDDDDCVLCASKE